ncbi:hypothetical protein JW935_00610 [candidate division KSB1 bacterium]|nr:hypothetical protein [candidate division KSB1 bacterium]
MNKRSLIFLFLLATSAFAQSGFHIVEKNQTSLVLEWTSPDLDWDKVSINNVNFYLPVLGSLPLSQESGKPQLPMDVYRLPLPVDSCIVTVLDSMAVTEKIGAICPAPRYQLTGPERQVRLSYEADPVDYSNSFYPLKVVAIESAKIRNQKIWRLAVHPLRYSQTTSMVRHYRYLLIKVSLVPDRSKVLPGRRIPIRAIPASTDQIVRVLCATDGVYKITGADLQNIGLSPGDMPPQTIRLYNQGEKIPLILLGTEDGRFDPGDEFLFFGQRRRGETEYYSAWSDTNVYRLEWGGEAGLRYNPRISYSTRHTSTSIRAILHLEQDLDYHEGDTDEEIQKTEHVPGEGWVWRFINRGEKQRVSFDLPGFVKTGDSLHVRLRLRGTTLDKTEPDHHVRLSVNGRVVKDAYFNDREELLLSAAAPPDYFIAAGNQLEIFSVNDLGAELSQFYLDWIEFDYFRKTSADNGLIRLMENPAAGAGQYLMNGFSSADLFVWDTGLNNSIIPELAGQIARKNITIRSAGISDGNLAQVLIDGLNVITARRGFNVVILDSQTGEIGDIRYFDTWLSADDAANLALFLNNLSPGTVVCAAIRDEGTAKLNEAVYTAFEGIGSAFIRKVGLRGSFAIIGRKGAEIGTVMENYSPEFNGPAMVSEDVNFLQGGTDYGVVFSDSLTSGELLVFEKSAAKKPVLQVADPQDLIDGGNGADYIIITHKDFKNYAKSLADYRSVFNNFRTSVVDVQDIYDTFNYSLKAPEAIQKFLRQAFENWPKPAPAYVLLFGDASWDPKLNQPDSRKRDFVPSFGNPVSDEWFVCFDGEKDLLADMFIGRLPVENAQEAQSVVDKIIEYESSPDEMWNKNFLFISGGFDFVEQSIFNHQSVYLAEHYVDKFPVHGNSVLINKETEGLKSGEHRQDILDAMNEGAVWTNFIGHAGSRTWDLMFYNPDIEALENGPRYPFITSMTCHTGRFAEPDTNSFGEHFIRVPDRGAVAFWGTSGWGYVSEDFLFLQRLYPIVLQDSVRVLGDAITRAKTAMWETFGASTHIQNMILQYCLLGDPALKLVLPEKPDLAVLPVDLTVAPAVPSEADSIAAVLVRVRNLGLSTYPDSVQVDLYAHHPVMGKIQIDSTVVLPVVGHSDSLIFYWPLRKMSGSVRLEVVVDAQNLIAESDENNNRQELQVSVLSSNLELASPVGNQIVPSDFLSLQVRNPQVRRVETPYFEFEIDTTGSFDSPSLQTSGPVPAQILQTRWTPADILSRTVHFWRCRNSMDNAWFTTAFYPHDAAEFGWRQQHGAQFADNKLFKIKISGHSLQLDRIQVAMYAESAGYTDGNYARIVVNEEAGIEPQRGHNLVVVDPGTGQIIAEKSFDTWADSLQAEQMAEFIADVENGFYVLAAIRDEGSNNMTENAFRALESIGSAMCRSVGSRDSWAIIGLKGTAVGSVREKLVKTGRGTAIVTDTLSYFPEKGQCLSEKIGPAAKWKQAEWSTTIPDECSLMVKVIAQNNNTGITDTLAVADGPVGKITLGGLEPLIYPQIRLLAEFGTKNGLLTPILFDWQVTYDPVPDPAVGPKVLSLSADTVLVGQDILCSLNVYNIGQATADSVLIRFEESDPASGRRTFAEQKIRSVAPDSAVTLQQNWPSAGKTGTVQLYFSVDPDFQLSELSETNNTLVKPVYVLPDTSGPQLSITFDDREILDGDMVSSEPKIRIRILDNSPAPVSDTAAVNVLLDGRRMAFSAEKNSMELAFEGPNKSTVQLTPQLPDGNHVLDAIVADASGNYNSLQISFRVVSDLQLFKVLNVPNPFADATNFTFEISQPADVQVKIYTVAGRLIQMIDAGWCAAGFNSFYWDGRDAEGDEIANGVYIYKVFATSNSQKTEALSKIVVMR